MSQQRLLQFVTGHFPPGERPAGPCWLRERIHRGTADHGLAP